MPPGEDPIAQSAYDTIAEDYTEDIEANPYNAELDFPGTTSLIPDVTGKRVLDAGCGTGKYAAWLHDNGADVVGCDVSADMLAEAQSRVDDAVPFVQADLGTDLPFTEECAFDGIVCGLALDYVADWTHVFDEFQRLLTPGGFLVWSVSHPFDAFPLAEDENYFETERRTKNWTVEIPYYRRPLEAMLTPLLNAGFALETLTEPQPTDGFHDQWPERYEKERRHPVFLAVHATNPP